MKLEDVISELKAYDKQVNIMEVCGTHTASIFRNGIRSLISNKIRLISGPGCPVCITPSEYIDRAIEWSMKQDCILLTFGDMMKVAGTKQSLSEAKADGAKVEIMYSPLDAVKKAKERPNITYIIAAVGFETTVPAYALVLEQIINSNIKNVKFLTALRRVMPALEFVCANDSGINGFIAPGHVSSILGSKAYEELAVKYGRPFAVAGFEGEHILAAIYDIAKQTEKDKAEVHNLYSSSVREEGNTKALGYINKYFEFGTAAWRGLGEIPDSGLYLRPEYLDYDAGSFGINDTQVDVTSPCRCAEVIIGKINPDECPLFKTVCTPTKAKGPCMVSSEGACGIWYRFSK